MLERVGLLSTRTSGWRSSAAAPAMHRQRAVPTNATLPRAGAQCRIGSSRAVSEFDCAALTRDVLVVGLTWLLAGTLLTTFAPEIGPSIACAVPRSWPCALGRQRPVKPFYVPGERPCKSPGGRSLRTMASSSVCVSLDHEHRNGRPAYRPHQHLSAANAKSTGPNGPIDQNCSTSSYRNLSAPADERAYAAGRLER